MTHAEKQWWDELEQHFYPIRDFIELHVSDVGPTISQRRVRFATAAMNNDIADMLIMLHAALSKQVDHSRTEYVHDRIRLLIEQAKQVS